MNHNSGNDTQQSERHIEAPVLDIIGNGAGAAIPHEAERLQNLEMMRATLIVCLGGSGQQIGVQLKAILRERFGELWRSKIRLLAFDTALEPESVMNGSQAPGLENGSELFYVGDVPTGSILRNRDRHPAIRKRFGGVAGRLPATAIQNGAKMIRPLGGLALMWHFPTVYREIESAIWGLAGRDVVSAHQATSQQGINVFICGGLGGGTGSGMFLDVACIVRGIFDKLGNQSQFCHITGIGILPQAFRKVTGKNLYANTGAALQELEHLMQSGNFRSSYPGEHMVDLMATAPFQIYYVLDGVDERGQTWKSLHAVARMAAEGIYLQMATQLGMEGENAFDNVSHAILEQLAGHGSGFLSSFGLGHLEFAAPDVARLCAYWFLEEQTRNAWLRSADPDAVTRQADSRLQALTAASLSVELLQDSESGGELRIDLRRPAWLLDKRPEEIAGMAAQYVRDFEQARLNEEIVGKIQQNARRVVEREKQSWQAWVDRSLLGPDTSIPTVHLALQQMESRLANLLVGVRRRSDVLEGDLEHARDLLEQRETAVAGAAGSIFFGRSGRIGDAVKRYFQAADAWLQLLLQQAQNRAQLQVWSELSKLAEEMRQAVQTLAERLERVAGQVQAEAKRRARDLEQRGVSCVSLADEAYVRKLYARYKPGHLNLRVLPGLQTRGANGEVQQLQPLQLAALSTHELRERLLVSATACFEEIAQLTVEHVITERSSEMTPQARREQVFQLATPSWSIDFTQMPGGSAGLSRIEVLGVPDAVQTNFGNEGVLVSTYDPYRITAYVMVSGAPQGVLQEYAIYRQMMERMRTHVPLFVLPEFMADADQGKLAFALGTIFGLISSQGTHFYYQPGDALEPAVKLGQGMFNAIGALENAELICREIKERVDGQIAQMGLQSAIATLQEYYTSPTAERSQLGDLVRELKQLVRGFADELRQIQALQNPGDRMLR